MNRFGELVRELDGKVDAIGLGGIDRYLYTARKRYTIRDADRLARIAVETPVVDGSGVKNTLERKTIEYLQSHGILDFERSKVMVVCAVDRFGMAQTIAKLAKDVVFGDVMFNLNIPIPMRSYRSVCLLADALLPVVSRLPFSWIYPTGEKQDVIRPKYGKYYGWADVIAGDFLIVKRTLPTPDSGYLAGKSIVTNTVTEHDLGLLRERGVELLVTSSPAYDGRYYATNVFEGIMITLLGKRPEEATVQDYESILAQLDWKPTITKLVSPSF